MLILNYKKAKFKTERRNDGKNERTHELKKTREIKKEIEEEIFRKTIPDSYKFWT